MAKQKAEHQQRDEQYGPAARPVVASDVAGADAARFHIDTSELKSSYCNVCNASSTREEVVLSLGVNNNWELERGSGNLQVKLLHRIILSPFAAKRLSQMLVNLMRDYETRHGELQ